MEDYGQSSGANIRNDFVSQHENIVMVICGHVSTDKVVMNERVGVNGNVVKELLINPQATDMFYEGAGIVTMLYFSEDGKTVQVENYSTTQEAFYRKDCQFEFDLQVVDPDAPVTPEEPTYSELSIGEIKMTFDVYLEETVEGSTVVVGLFDSNNKLLDIREYPAEPNITAQFTYNPETKYARAFCVKDGTAYPVCMKVEKTVK